MANQAGARPELGPMLREARLARSWTVEHVMVALGFFTGREGERVRVLNRTQVNRIEAGERALSAEEAWRFVEIYPELDALTLLRAANTIDEDASEEFLATIEQEAARRRQQFQGGNRRRSERSLRVVTAASEVVAAVPAGAALRAGSGRTGDCAGSRKRVAA
jgi:hypothetical protein